MAFTVPASFLKSDSPGLEAFDQWAVARGMRGKDLAETVSNVMKYWVSFAMAKVPRGDRAKVRENLTRLVSTYSAIDRQIYSGKRNKDTRRADALRGTVAAAIVAILNYKGARELARQRSPEFYSKVREFIGKREYSVNHHRGGFIPAINVLGRGKGSTAGDRPPKYRHPSGLIAHQFTDELAEILVENFASQSGDHPFRTRPDGITGIAGDAFDAALGEVLELVSDFLQKDMLDAARSAGFTVTSK